MKRVLILLALLPLACTDQNPSAPRVSQDPVSVRGWVVDVEGGPSAPFRTAETEAARKAHLFQQTYVEVVNAPWYLMGSPPHRSARAADPHLNPRLPREPPFRNLREGARL